MKRIKKVLSLLLAGVLAFSSAGTHVYAANNAKDAARPEDGMTKNQPFASGTGGSNNFRIPCLVTLDDGTIVAGCDARWGWQMDGGGLDTIVSRSTDKGKTWNYTFANYLGDNGNVANKSSTAFIDPAMATDGETVWMIADLFPAGVALNGANYAPKTGHTGYDQNHNLVLAKSTDTVNAASNSVQRAAASFDYHLEKIEGVKDDAEAYYVIKDAQGNAVEGYEVDAFFNIKGNNVDTNLFCGDSPYFVYPTDFLYMTKSTDGGATWSIPMLIDVKGKEEQTLLVGPGRGTVMENGRIVFTAYEFTNSDIASCCIYSDDQGKTWKRGEDVSQWSSEAVVTEADGRLYMFTRHGNAYYTSEDGGQTWSPKKDTGIPYWHNCQLSAITYSEKIDGKTAIIFSAPSSTTGRNAGKLFVGLVQENGTLDWAYEYSVNGAGDAYAYSCLDECEDGSIALLYEGGSCPITYENIPIEEIVKGASIGERWITDAEGRATTSVMMRPSDKAQIFTVQNGPETAEVTLSEKDVVTASYTNGQLTVTPNASATGYHRVAVTVAGVTLYVEVADVDFGNEESFEKVLLSRGETVSIEDRTGYYVDHVDESSLDKNIADVEVTGTNPVGPETPGAGELQAQLATANGQFNGKKINVSDCLYTFTASNSENTYTISGTAENGTTVYLHHRFDSVASRPNRTQSSEIVVEKHSSEAMFALRDTTGTGGSYLYFYHDNAGKLHFDRTQAADGGHGYFELYTRDASAADSAIAGYKRVTQLSEIKSGQKYLIVTKEDSARAKYLLHPTDQAEAYRHVAKLTEEVIVPTQETMQAQLGSDANYNGDKVSLQSCLYTFAKAGAENTYHISGTTADQAKAYLSVNATSTGCPQQGSAVSILLAYDEGQKAFTLRDKNGGDRYLYFYTGDSGERKLIFDKWGAGSTKPEVYFELYEKTADAQKNSDIAGYQKLSSLTEVRDGGQYLITTKATDGNVYLLHPSLSTTDKFSHAAKVVESEALTTGTTTVTITGKEEGETSVKVGSKTYLISVRNNVEKLTLKVGEAFTVPGTEYKELTQDQEIVTLTKNTDKPPYVQQPAIKSGEKYLLGRSNHVIVNRAGENKPSGAPDGLAMDAVNLNVDEVQNKMWTAIDKGNGTYSLQAADGKYLTFNNNAVVLSETEQALTVAKRTRGGFSVSYGGQYLNDWAGSHNYVAGYHSDDNDWYFYAPLEGMIITGAKAGQTEIMFGGTTYQITVICADGAHNWGEWTEGKPQTCTTHGTKECVCTICHAKDIEIVSAAHELPNEWKTETQATCSRAGVEKRECTRCDYYETREIPKLGHQWEDTMTIDVAATCGTKGSKSYHCAVCDAKDETRVEEIPATGLHAFGEWQTVTSPTCQTEGERQRICSECQFVDRETLAPEADNHVWNTDKTVDKAPTCTEAGSKSIHCKVEGCTARKDSETMEALGHDFQNYISDENATCQSDGTETAACGREGCTATDTRTVEGSKLEHKYTNYVYQNDATCEADGHEIAECDYGCGMADTRVKEGTKLDHVFETYVSDGNATCTKDGTKTAICKLCGRATDTVAEKGSAKGHAWSNWYTVKQPTTEAEGLEERICTRPGCTQRETRAIAKLTPPADGNQGGNSGNTDTPSETPNPSQGNGQGAAQGNSQAAKTGDESNAGLYIGLMVVAVAAAAGFFVWKKKKDGKDRQQ